MVAGSGSLGYTVKVDIDPSLHMINSLIAGCEVLFAQDTQVNEKRVRRIYTKLVFRTCSYQDEVLSNRCAWP